MKKNLKLWLITILMSCAFFSAQSQVSVESITTSSLLQIMAGDSPQQIVFEVLPENATDKSVTFTSSSPEIATVNSSGIVTPVDAGTTEITIQSQDGSAILTTIIVEVIIENFISDIQFAESAITIYEQETYNTTYEVLPVNAPDKTVTYTTSDPTVAEINPNGVIIANNMGTCVITAISNADPTITTTMEVTVMPIGDVPPQITIMKTSTTLNINQTETIEYQILPLDYTNQEVVYTSSNINIATVNTSGVITAISAGDATVTITMVDGSFSSSMAVHVNAKYIPVTGIEILQNEFEIMQGESTIITPLFSPSNATDQTFTAVSSNENVVSILNNELVTLSQGTATVTVTSNDNPNVTASINITVVPNVVTGIETSNNEVTLFMGDIAMIDYVVTPATASQNVFFSSDDPTIATVSQSGVITGIAAGTTPIIISSVADPSVSTTVTATVTAIPAETITIVADLHTVTLKKGETSQLITIVTPPEATIFESITFTSSDESIATVNSNGVVTGITPGQCTVTATIDNVSDAVVIEVEKIDCDDTTPPTAINEIVEYSFENETGSSTTTQVELAVAPNANYSHVWANEQGVPVATGDQYVYTAFQHDSTHALYVWGVGEGNCHTDTTIIYLAEKACSKSFEVTSDENIYVPVGSQLPILGTNSKNAVWYDANNIQIARSQTLDLNTLFSVNDNYSVFVREEVDGCTSSLKQIDVNIDSYSITGNVTVFNSNMNESFIININNGEYLLETDEKGNFEFKPQQAGTYAVTIGTQSQYLCQTDSILTVTINPNTPHANCNFELVSPEDIDVMVDLIGMEPAVVGRSMNMLLLIHNMGPKLYNVPVTITYPEEVEFVIADMETYTEGTGTVDFVLDSIEANSDLDLMIFFEVLPDWTLMDSTIIFTAHIDPFITELDTMNNTSEFMDIILNSFDPNDKAVTPSYSNEGYVLFDKELTYRIRFQNTGTIDAENVYVIDTISDLMDINTFEVIDYSHDMTWKMKDGIVRFDFADIHLPDSTTDEPGSHGYIIYKIKPKSGMDENTVVTNTAHIFFDYNPAVVTNTTQSEYVSKIPENTTGQILALQKISNNVQVIPNPATNFITVLHATNCSITITNETGVTVSKINTYAGNKIDVSTLPSGVYTITVTGKKTNTIQFVK